MTGLNSAQAVMMTAFPVFRSLSPFTDGLPVIMPSSILLLSAATGMVMTNPQLIPAWCLLGAIFIAIFTIYQAREKGHNAGRCAMVGLSSVLTGVALPRPIFHYMGVIGLEYWPPEFFVLCGAGAGMVGWTLMNTGYSLVTNSLPGVVTNTWNRVFGKTGQPSKDDDT